MTGAVHLDEFCEISPDRGQRGPHVRVMCAPDVIDEPVQRPARHVRVVARIRRRQGLQRARDDLWIHRGRLARFRDRPAATATEVDSELLKDARGAEIARDNLANRGALE